MSLLSRIETCYKRVSPDFNLVVGLNPCHFEGFPMVPFTWLFKGDELYTDGLGISLEEVVFFEYFFFHYKPRTVLVIGNSFGFSSIVFSLLNPQARVLAVDAGYAVRAEEGIALTNSIASKEGLSLNVVKGVSPDDIAKIIAEASFSEIDFVFIDGTHETMAVYDDFCAVDKHMSPIGAIAFHDLFGFNLYASFVEASKNPDYQSKYITATTSGIGLVYKRAIAAQISFATRMFIPPNPTLERINLEKFVWQRR